MTTTVEAAPLNTQLQDLRNGGANQADPVRFRYLEALALRLQAKGLQHTRHWQKLEQAIADYRANYPLAAQPAQSTEATLCSPLSDLLDRLNQPLDAPATEPRSTFEQLVFGTTEEGTEAAQAALPVSMHQPLKAMAKVSAGREEQALLNRIRNAIEQVPKDAGPINAHRLVSRAMAEMQTLSPAYLNRLVSYTDTLMALERLGRKDGKKPSSSL